MHAQRVFLTALYLWRNSYCSASVIFYYTDCVQLKLSYRIPSAITALALLAAVAALMFKPAIVQDGCDSPAHFLMSETLFKAPRQTGDPALRQELSQALVARGSPLDAIDRAVGPLCTHWNGQRQHNQYPPGVGLVLSPFPFATRPLAFGFFVFAIALAPFFFLSAKQARDGAFALVCLAPYILPFLYPFHISFVGLLPAFGFVVLATVLTLKGGPRNAIFAGAALGCAVLFRYDAIFPTVFLFGIAALAPQRLAPRAKFELLAFMAIAFLAFGIVPLSYYQWISVGNPFMPVTPSYDFANVRTFGALLENFGENFNGARLKFWIVALTGLAAFTLDEDEGQTQAHKKIARYFVCYCIILVGFLSFKEIHQPYYMWSLSAIGFALLLVASPKIRLRQLRTAIGLLVIPFSIILAVGSGLHYFRQMNALSWVREKFVQDFPKQAPAWIYANQWSGLLDALRLDLGLDRRVFIVDSHHTPGKTHITLDHLLVERNITRYSVDLDPESHMWRWQILSKEDSSK